MQYVPLDAWPLWMSTCQLLCFTSREHLPRVDATQQLLLFSRLEFPPVFLPCPAIEEIMWAYPCQYEGSNRDIGLYYFTLQLIELGKTCPRDPSANLILSYPTVGHICGETDLRDTQKLPYDVKTVRSNSMVAYKPSMIDEGRPKRWLQIITQDMYQLTQRVSLGNKILKRSLWKVERSIVAKQVREAELSLDSLSKDVEELKKRIRADLTALESLLPPALTDLTALESLFPPANPFALRPTRRITQTRDWTSFRTLSHRSRRKRGWNN